jgi:hypothetical protein
MEGPKSTVQKQIQGTTYIFRLLLCLLGEDLLTVCFNLQLSSGHVPPTFYG